MTLQLAQTKWILMIQYAWYNRNSFLGLSWQFFQSYAEEAREDETVNIIVEQEVTSIKRIFQPTPLLNWYFPTWLEHLILKFIKILLIIISQLINLKQQTLTITIWKENDISTCTVFFLNPSPHPQLISIDHNS